MKKGTSFIFHTFGVVLSTAWIYALMFGCNGFHVLWGVAEYPDNPGYIVGLCSDNQLATFKLLTAAGSLYVLIVLGSICRSLKNS